MQMLFHSNKPSPFFIIDQNIANLLFRISACYGQVFNLGSDIHIK